MLSEHEVISYLLDRNLVSRETIVEGDLVVGDASRRNRNFKIISERGPSYLLKLGFDAERVETIAREAKVYETLHSEAQKDGFARYLPHFYGYDGKEHVLILEFLRDGHDLRDYHVRFGRFSTGLAALMGLALGTLHRETQLDGQQDDYNQVFKCPLPWILSINRPDLSMFQEMSSANIQVIKIVQQFAEFGELLNGLKQQWKERTLIHFDIRWDNCMVAKSSAGLRTGLKVVDWELAGLGDPCWDIGSVFMDYISFWLLSIPITGDTPPDRFSELARYPLAKMQPAMQSFWQSYKRQMELDTATADQWLLRAVRYGAGRLLQTALEQTQMSVQLTGTVVCLLQLSLNILKRPQEAIVHLLGIPS